MPRQKKQTAPPTLTPVAEPEIEPEIVPDGDFAGMAVDDVLRLTTDRVHDSLGDVDLDVAGAALDMAVGEYLEITEEVAGSIRAKTAAVQFMTTAFPYAKLELGDDSQSYRKIREEKKT